MTRDARIAARAAVLFPFQSQYHFRGQSTVASMLLHAWHQAVCLERSPVFGWDKLKPAEQLWHAAQAEMYVHLQTGVNI